ncbi:MAG: hypothetical protein BECKG1743F_GA0114225_109042, partial [Candidatus Kentron sp. G]
HSERCACYCALNPDENPAQFGIFFSANRLRREFPNSFLGVQDDFCIQLIWTNSTNTTFSSKAISIKEYTNLLVFIVQFLRCNNRRIVNDAPVIAP